MIKGKKVVSTVLFLLGVTAVANIFYPQIGEKIRNIFSKLPLEKQVDEISGKTGEVFGEILSEEPEQDESELSQEKAVEQLKELPAKVLNQEVIEEVKEKVNQIVIEKIKEVKEIPERQMEEVKTDIKNQLYQEICEEWLKEN